MQTLSSAGLTGRGVTVAIIDAYDSPTIVADANAYSVLQHEPQFGPGQFTDLSANPGTFNDQALCGGEAGWNREQTLDVEAVHGVAPGASIEYYGAQNCDSGIDTELNRVVQDDTAQIVSNSYGDAGEGGLGNEVTIEHSIFLQGATEGIGFYFSTGGGGGASRLFTQPLYQHGIVPVALSEMHSGTPMRVVPDVAAVGDPETGYLICINASSTGGQCRGTSLVQIGGTSLACPVFAAIQSLASQGRHFPIGFANPSLYQLPLAAFHDVRSANAPNHLLAMMTASGHTLITMDHDTSLTDAPGYDDTTGRGTPNGAVFVLAEHLLGGGGTH